MSFSGCLFPEAFEIVFLKGETMDRTTNFVSLNLQVIFPDATDGSYI